MMVNNNTGLGDINDIISSIASGISKIGTAVIANSSDVYYSGKYQLPAINTGSSDQPQWPGLSSTQLIMLVALGGAAIIGTVLYIKRKKTA